MDKKLICFAMPLEDVVEESSASPKKRKRVAPRWRSVISLCVYLIAIPAAIFIGVKLFDDRKYNIISLIIAFLACVPFFIGFERGKTGARELVVIAVLTALSVVGRLIFAPLPGFKPVTAMVIITGIAYGMQAGFVTGALSAVVSNIFYGQGPWTPFQMFVWGFLGLLSGLIFKRGQKAQPLFACFGGNIGRSVVFRHDGRMVCPEFRRQLELVEICGAYSVESALYGGVRGVKRRFSAAFDKSFFRKTQQNKK